MAFVDRGGGGWVYSGVHPFARLRARPPRRGTLTDTEPLTLAGEFPPATRQQWQAGVDKVLAGRDADLTPEDLAARFERTLVTHTYDGIAIQPLYTADDVAATVVDGGGLPGSAPFVRGSTPAAGAQYGWDVRQRVDVDDEPKRAAETILAELERGSSSVLLGLRGSTTIDVDLLDDAFDGVFLELVPVVLDAGDRQAEAGEALIELWDRRANPHHEVSGNLGLDPVGLHASQGGPRSALDESLRRSATLAQRCADGYPKVRAVVVDATPFHEAGGSDTEELGCAIASGLTYVRALTDGGLDVAQAFGQLEFRFAATTDQFLTIAKLRAARRLWNRVGEVLGVPEEARAQHQNAVTSTAMATRYDPWVNLLRTTVACFGAGVGGADSVTVVPYDELLSDDDPSELGRRMARNTQAILIDESHLARVIDPGGGSWYIESLTDTVAATAWTWFQEIEAAGGLADALVSGVVADRIAGTWAKRSANLARRIDPLTGVSEFPNIADDVPPVPPSQIAQARKSAGDARASAGAEQIEALPRVRYAQGFEDLRSRVDDHVREGGDEPVVFLVNLGTAAEYTARTTFAKNFFEAGGLRTDSGGSVDDFVASGASLVCVCSSDPRYAEDAQSTVAALRDAGAVRIYLAGKPKAQLDALTSAGVDEFISVGCDLVEVLTHALDLALDHDRDLGGAR